MLKNFDWKKRAASVLTDEETEMAFMRQAFVFLENRARPFIQEPYFIGFEIIEKNDANTNLAGIFVFRVGTELFYAPCFYKNGEIKGINLLYCAKERMFKPLNQEWCNFFIGKYASESPAKIDANSQKHQTRGINFRDLAHPHYAKSASADTRKVWKEMEIKLSEKQASISDEKYLTKFLKVAGTTGMKSLLNGMEKSMDFADKLHSFYDEDEWLNLDIPNTEKTAAVTVPGSLILHAGEFNPNSDVSMDEQFGFGYSLEDTRKNKSTVYLDRENYGEGITDPGKYKVLGHDGSWKELLVIPVKHITYNRSGLASEPCTYHGDTPEKFPLSSNTLEEAGYNLKGDTRYKTYLLVDPESKKYKTVHTNEIFGHYISDLESNVEVGSIKGSQPLAIFCARNNDQLLLINRKFKVTKDEELTKLSVEAYGDKTTIIINPNVKCVDLDLGVYPEDAIMLQLKGKPSEYASDEFESSLEFNPGSDKTLNDFLLNQGFEKVTVKKAHDRFQLRYKGQTSFELNNVNTAVALAKEFRIDGKEAMALVKHASEASAPISILVQKAPMQKEARITVSNMPDLHNLHNNPDFNVTQDRAESHIISTDHDGDPYPTNRVGDKYEMDGMRVTIETGTPEQIYEMSADIKSPELFDLGVVGTLIKTYDGSEVVDAFMPDMNQGLDKIGRLLFLLYWKPEDFVESYGSDDISDLENALVSNFKSFGELILGLMQQFKFEDSANIQSLAT